MAASETGPRGEPPAGEGGALPGADAAVRAALLGGMAIPAHPLALTASGRFDERHQRALTRYYLDAGAGGLAVGVHTTQFEIRAHGLLEPVLALAAETARAADARAPLLVAGVCGPTAQALAEAEGAARLGYDAGLLSLAALREAPLEALLEHCRAVAEAIPLFGFYLQPAVGGRELPPAFWEAFFAIPSVVAVKVAPFDRYRTREVVRALAESGREDVALYTGNDDHILLDLLAEHRVATEGGERRLRFAGGLLGHWAVWTRRAVEQLARCRAERDTLAPGADTLALAEQVTEANAALFDPHHRFAGCIPGLHTVLHGQGLLASPRTLDPAAALSPGQATAIERVRRRYPHLTDDAFVAANRERWLA
ncbi:MAG TPA: dihydrodipicolinate synthase family protein [Longimicrobiales bacterium]|nr:dihydrodipicolinate synthase family protein [Longimicrobiales bacterium]